MTFVCAGLPQIAKLTGDAKFYPERLFKLPRIGSLDEEDAPRALAEAALAEGLGSSRMHSNGLSS
ncbi:hypothetical protein [Arthrobacter sp. VKM Ac-2550]|uniref:hypothetical protein n=1 Tax=Crystallibacter permensis TaxID=1938888 RepID=UPI00222801D5|nr:hypothetical protein [Arthrobacter sp. VKM Ac-2550]MCW2134158.1 hypothetical protein [Arthrobacter sp. VKM Ac-2550]